MSLAGCSDQLGGGGDGGDGGDGGVDPVQDRVTVDPADIEEGGTFRAAIGEGPDSFDFAYSSSASASILHNLIFEGMVTTDASGEIYPWLAESYEQVDVQDVSPADYADYMTSVPYTETEDGAMVIDTDAQIVLEHPDNDPASGDDARVLTVEEAGDAVADGTYGMHFRFDLHEGVTFHNGNEMTADNVVESYERIRNSTLSGQYYDSMLDIQADGDYTVHLYIQEPDAAAVLELGDAPIYPSESATLPPEAMDPRQGNTPMGTGMFELDEFQEGEYVVFTAFDDYWFDTEMKDWFEGSSEFPNGPVVDEVDVSFVSEDASRSAALQEGEIDMSYGLTASTLNDYQNSEDFRTAPTDGAGYTFLQHPVTVEPFTDKRVRQAINHLIPRENIAQNIFSGWENPAWTPLPPVAAGAGTDDYEQLVEDGREYNEYDQERAAELVEEAIEDNGWETPIEVQLETNSDNDDRVRTVELIQEALNRSEYFEASLETYEFLDFIGQLLSEEYYDDGKFAFIGLSGGFNPHGYAKSVHSQDNFAQCCNFQNINDDELSQLLRDARYGVDVAQDPELRQERYNAVWERVLELSANSYGTHSTLVGVVDDTVVNGFNTYPSTQDIIGYGLFAPQDEQITYLSR
ncbi:MULTISPECIES: ABC transporter substrate-binding protein [Halomicrobium]|uniref:Extracellular solute-binding protein family 5 n=2 Tax=Halomicrobium mukohataei TaxID=57705 RepID=C7NYL4_HALMD|nr:MULTISPECIES: ABC transporter substrate-binding protein [Halomicrobium]ACV46675.1 extracellular solute-binding protein family 5 [Halomicrobium mukohataei DSM 12286]QCD65184.1 ABC transporter substrate-binding protein [Halomicrobium mukohataei]QFR19990.1 ABC transporter substrate-binding protein [Halomicrobium sp. ZPS1]